MDGSSFAVCKIDTLKVNELKGQMIMALGSQLAKLVKSGHETKRTF